MSPRTGKTSRAKGASAEREIVQLLREYGWQEAERTSNGRSQSGRGDFANGPNVHLEAKRCERAEVWKWWEQVQRDADPDSMYTLPPVVVFRRSRSPWLALLSFEELLALLRLERAWTEGNVP